MRYQDSIRQAQAKLAKAQQQLELWSLAASPINYAIGYEFVTEKNIALIDAIDSQLATGKKLDNYFIEELFKHHVLGQSNFRTELFDELEQVVDAVDSGCQTSYDSAQYLLDELDESMHALRSGSGAQAKATIKSLTQTLEAYQTQQQMMFELLAKSKAAVTQLQTELEQTKKDLHLDPLTGLYNRRALTKHLDAWFADDPHRRIAAIVINLEQFSQFIEQFGGLISDIVLSKIAKRISGYVGDSGLPVRTSGDEFFIFLPDVDEQIALEVAEKMAHSVAKLRFVSSKTGVKLPKLRVSMAVTEVKPIEPLAKLIERSRDAISQKPQSQPITQVTRY